MILTVPNDMLVTFTTANSIIYHGKWDIGESYNQDEYVLYFNGEDLTFGGIYNSSISYSKGLYVFKDGYYYLSLVDNNTGNITDSSNWKKLSCYYKSTKDYNVGNVPSDVSDYWKVFDPYAE